jgi:hypothetical protein
MDCIDLTLKVLTVTFGVYVKSNDQYSVIKVFLPTDAQLNNLKNNIKFALNLH